MELLSQRVEMITLENVQKSYQTPAGKILALQDINLKVAAGEIYGIIGKSGAGKSTLIRCVNLLEKPTGGQIRVAGETLTALDASALRKARRKIGMIFQQFNLLSGRTVFDNISLPLEFYGYPKAQIHEIIQPLLELTGLVDKKNSYPAQLSGGQKQRVAIARALAAEPHVLLSDEATSALDPETTLSILKLLKDIRDRLKITILLITHEMSVIKAACDRVGILEGGRLIEENEVSEFFSHPETLTAKNFIASSMLHHLPPVLQDALLPHEEPGTYPILRLWFTKGTATQPIISELSHQFHLHINILQANLEYIKNHAMGLLIICMLGSQNTFRPAIDYLERAGVKVEVMGYVRNSFIPFS